MQIAHIDHDHSNSTEDNLVALCLQHHDAYDTTPRQTKKLTKAEVRTYRQSLYDLLEKKSRLVQASFLGPEGKRTTSATNAHRLGQIVEAFDEDMGRVEPNGARLTSLAIRFAVDEGDFTAARQAEIELMRVIEASKTDAPWFSDYRERDNPECDPVSMLLRASSFIGQLDWRHAFGIVHLAAWRAFLGDGESYKGLSICDVPCPRVRSYAAYLIAVTSNEPYPFSPRVREFALDELENLACRVTAAVAIQGIELPETPGRMSKRGGWRVLATERESDPEGRESWLCDAFIGIVHEIAKLKSPDFEAIIRGLPSKAKDRSNLFSIADRGDEPMAFEEAKAISELWTTDFSSVIYPAGKLRLSTSIELDDIVSHVADCRRLVASGLERLRTCLLDERTVCSLRPGHK